MSLDNPMHQRTFSFVIYNIEVVFVFDQQFHQLEMLTTTTYMDWHFPFVVTQLKVTALFQNVFQNGYTR